jgi:uncharacterized Zn finger protein
MAELPQLTVQDIRQRANEESFRRGKSYYNNGAITNTVRRGSQIEARCKGSSPTPYRVEAVFGKQGVWETSCTCPYDWGGDCKHIVAFLLAYVHEPEAFVERPTVDEALTERSKEDIIALIGEMLARHPDLEMLLDRPTPRSHPRCTPINTESFRRELRYAIDNYEGWGDRTAEQVIHNIAGTASQFAAAGDWISARAICSAVLEEALLDDSYVFDDEGDFIVALDAVVQPLVECLEQPVIVQNDGERRAVFTSLLDAIIWNINMGGVDFAADAGDALLAHATPADMPFIRERLQPEREKQLSRKYGHWSAEAYEDILSELDALGDIDPDTTLARLRDEGLYSLAFEKLMQWSRFDEAIALAAEHLTSPYERWQAVYRLAGAGYETAAIQLAEETLQTQFDDTLSQWLIERYQKCGDSEAVLRLQHTQMLASPAISYYEQLHQTAAALGRWQEMRPAIIQRLEEQKRFDVLTYVYLYEEAWDAAWEMQEKAARQSLYGPDYLWGLPSLELEVAERSCHARPRRALEVYLKHARRQIEGRSRQHYQVATDYLSVVRDLHRELGEEAAWEDLIAGIREEFKRLPALQDELNQAGL